MNRSTSTIPPSPGAVSAWKWGIVWMLFLATLINYMDRQALGSTSPFIKAEFALSEEQYGWLESWFGLSFALFLVVSGFLADRFSLRWLFAGALLLWSAAGFATGLATCFVTLAACRIVLAIGESFNFPCAVGVIRRILPPEARGLGNGIFNSGMAFGAVAMPILVASVAGPRGEHWRTIFLVVGAGGSLWVALWLWGTRGERGHEIDRPPALKEKQVASPFARVFLLRQFWITLAVGVGINICWHFYRVWLPRHLDVDMGLNPGSGLQYALAAFYIMADLGSILTGYAARRMARSGRTVIRSRKRVFMAAAALSLLATPVVFKPAPWIMIPLLCIVGAALMGIITLFYSLTQEISPDHTSKCLGIIGATGWLVNSVIHPMVGRVADRFHPDMGRFAPMVLVAGILPILIAWIHLYWPEPKVDSAEAT